MKYKGKEDEKMYSFKENEKKKMLDEIAHFFKKEHDLDFGIIATENIFDFFVEVIGDDIYNIALNDTRNFFEKYLENMESDYYTLYKDRT